MNKCFLLGRITNMSEYKFFFNNKIHNAKITFNIYTLENNFTKKQLINLEAYDDVADFLYRNCKIEDVIFIEGKLIKNMKVEALYCLKTGTKC